MSTRLVEAVWQALAEIEDPEFPMSLVEMGLIYDVAVADGKASIKMTFTSMGCPCVDMMLNDIRFSVAQIDGIETVDIEIVWDPPWTHERLQGDAVEKLATWGVSV